MGKQKGTPPSKPVESDFIAVTAYEKWLEGNDNKAIYDDAFHRIIDFYVLHSPCKVSSYSPITLESLGWTNPWHSEHFRSAFDSIAGFTEGENFRIQEAKRQFREAWEDYGVVDFADVPPQEYAVIVQAGEGNPRMDLLHRIRNAFAHGRFAVKTQNHEKYVFLEDVDGVRGLQNIYVFARICIKKRTLIEWLDLFEKKSNKAKELSSLYR